jgi:hypothetical protein
MGIVMLLEGKVAWNGDALTRILGEEKPGHVHGLMLVPNPDKVLDCSKLGHLKNLNVISLDGTWRTEEGNQRGVNGSQSKFWKGTWPIS